MDLGFVSFVLFLGLANIGVGLGNNEVWLHLYFVGLALLKKCQNIFENHPDLYIDLNCFGFAQFPHYKVKPAYTSWSNLAGKLYIARDTVRQIIHLAFVLVGIFLYNIT